MFVYVVRRCACCVRLFGELRKVSVCVSVRQISVRVVVVAVVVHLFGESR